MKVKFALIFFVLLSVFCRYTAVAAKDSLKIVLISDINDSYGSTTYSPALHRAVEFIKESGADLVLCAGDMVAGQSLKLTDSQLQAMWQGFAQAVLQPLKQQKIEFAFTFGNHDGSASPKFAHERQIAKEFWRKNRPNLNYVDDSGFPAFYSFRVKNLFVAVIDASTSKISTEQQKWLEQQMISESAKSAQLRILLGHLPLFAIAEGRNRPGDVLADAEQLHSLFCRLGIDFYISGHHHACYFSKKDGLTMLSCGALGGGPRRHLGSATAKMKTLTELNINFSSASVELAAYEVGKTLRKINDNELPAQIKGFNGISSGLEKNSEK